MEQCGERKSSQIQSRRKRIVLALLTLIGLPALLVGGFFLHVYVIVAWGGYCLNSITAESAAGVAEQEFRQGISRIELEQVSVAPNTELRCTIEATGSTPFPYQADCRYLYKLKSVGYEKYALFDLSRCGSVSLAEGDTNLVK